MILRFPCFKGWGRATFISIIVLDDGRSVGEECTLDFGPRLTQCNSSLALEENRAYEENNWRRVGKTNKCPLLLRVLVLKSTPSPLVIKICLSFFPLDTFSFPSEKSHPAPTPCSFFFFVFPANTKFQCYLCLPISIQHTPKYNPILSQSRCSCLVVLQVFRHLLLA